MGSSWDTTTVSKGGSAYVFVRSGTTWTQQAKLIPSDTAANDYAGSAVVINSNTVVVGAWQKNSETGAAYVYLRTGTTWAQQAKLLATSGATYDRFGFSLALESNTLVLGAPLKNNSPSDAVGAVYVFTRTGTTWTQRIRILGATQNYFGWSVGISDTTLVGVGTGTSGGPQGVARVYTGAGTTWTLQQAFAGSDTTATDNFGSSLSMPDPTTILIGAINRAEGALTNSGAAYLFKYAAGTWTQTKRFANPDPATNDGFGNSVSYNSGLAVIGEGADDDAGNASGSVYIFPVP